MPTMMNGSSKHGNALSEQPAAVQQLFQSQLGQSKSLGPQAGSPDPAFQQLIALLAGGAPQAQSKGFDPALIFQLLGSLLQGSSKAPPSVAPVSSHAETKDFDPNALLQLLFGLLQQVGATKSAPIDKGAFNVEYRLGSGRVETFPTWSFWGETKYSMFNSGTVPTVVLANDRRYHLNPQEGTEDSGKFAAFPLRIINTSELPGSEVTIKVW
jgi:hypothetical protein